jgi:long-chain acyl-CoA synthetase
MKNLSDLLSHAASCFPDNKAICFEGKSMSYIELEKSVSKLAKNLLHLGIKKGDVCSVFLYSNLEFCIFYFACFKIGAIVMPMSFRLKAEDLSYFIDYAKPKLILTQPELCHELEKNQASHKSWQLVMKDSLKKPAFKETVFLDDLLSLKPSKEYLYPDVGPDDVAAYFSTSGTTGLPKLVIFQHKQFLANAKNHARLLNYKQNDVTLAPLAICFNLPFGHQFLASLYSGACIELMATFDPQKVLEKIQSKNCTLLYMVSSMYSQVMKKIPENTLIDHTLRSCIVAGEAVPLAIHQRFKKLFGFFLTEGIGMSEALFYAINTKQGYKLGSQGPAVMGAKVKVCNEKKEDLPKNTMGEIWIKSEMATALGYLDHPVQTQKTLVDGWLKTGDLAVLDEEGYIWFCGRISSLIHKNGKKIAPMEIEAVFYQHPCVLEACVVGVTKNEKVQIKAYIALRLSTSTDEKALYDFIKLHLDSEKIPDKIEFLDDLPKGISNKIDRSALQKMADQGI